MFYNSFAFLWFVVHDQIIFIPEAEPVFARTDKLFIYNDRIKVLDFPVLLFAIPGQENYIDQAHINNTCTLVSSV